MKRIFIDNVEYTNRVSLGFSTHEKLDYSLDVGSLFIRFSKRDIPFKMWSIIDIYEDDLLVFSGRVDLDELDISCKNPLLYSHTISIVEHTKVLETEIVKGKTFTQPISPEVPLYTLYDVIEDLRITSPLNLVGEDRSIFKISEELKTYLEGIIANDHTFNDMTLRECLNEVVSVVDAVVRINRRGFLSLDFFNETKTLIHSIDNFQHIKKRQDIELYATELESNVLNPISDDKQIERINVYPAPNAYSTARSQDFIFNLDSAFFPTPYPIYDVFGLNVFTRFTIRNTVVIRDEFGNATTGTVVTRDAQRDIDIGERVLENNTYRSLDSATLYSQGTQDITNINNFFQENTIKFDYGKENVDISNTFGLFQDKIALVNTLIPSGIRQLRGTTLDGITIWSDWTYNGEEEFIGVQGNNTVWERWEIILDESDFDKGYIPYNIFYTPIPREVRLSISRDNIIDVNQNTTLSINQQSRIVDITNFKDNLKGRVNKMGNSELELTHRVSSLQYAYNIGDFTQDKFIVSEREVIYFNDFYIVKYSLTRDFNKLSQFIGINSEVRQFEIAEDGRTLERDLLYKNFIEIYAETNDENEYTPDTQLKSKGIERVLKTLSDELNILPTTFGTIKTFSLEDEFGEFLLPINRSAGGKAITFSFSLENNASVGKKLDRETIFGISPLTRGANLFTPYTDFLGRIETAEIKLFDTINTYDTYAQRVSEGRALPNIGASFNIEEEEIISQHDLIVKKDSREVLKGSLIFEFLSKQSDLIIGKQFVDDNALIVAKQRNIKIRYYNDNLKTNIYATAPSNHVFEEDLNAIIQLENNTVFLNHSIIDDFSENQGAYAICDNLGRLYLAVNNPKNKKYIRFDFRRYRSGIEYFFEAEFNSAIEAYFQQITSEISGQLFKLYQANIIATFTNQFTATMNGAYVEKLYQGNINTNFNAQITAIMNGAYSFKTYQGSAIANFGGFSATINTTYLKPEFDFIGTAEPSQDHTLTYLVQGSSSVDCPSSTQVTNWLNSNYNASNYNLGEIIRVQAFVVDGEFPVATCSEFFYEVILSA